MSSRPSHQAVLPAGSCGPPCRPAEVPAITLPREVSLALWWRMLVKIAAALAKTWDVGGKALASWLAGAASCFSLWGSMDFMSANTCAWHSIGNQCKKGYEGTHKFRSIANLGLGETVSRESQPKEATSEPLERWRAGRFSCVCAQLIRILPKSLKMVCSIQY